VLRFYRSGWLYRNTPTIVGFTLLLVAFVCAASLVFAEHGEDMNPTLPRTAVADDTAVVTALYPHAALCDVAADSRLTNDGYVYPTCGEWKRPRRIDKDSAGDANVSEFVWTKIEETNVPPFQFLQKPSSRAPSGDVRTVALNTLRRKAGTAVFIDIGAGTGYFTLAALALGADVLAVEPVLSRANAIVAAARTNGSIRRLAVFNNAVGFEPAAAAIDATGRIVDVIADCRLPSVERGRIGREWTELVTVDQLLETELVGKLAISLIMVDAHMYEPQAINGMLGLLCTREVDTIILNTAALKEDGECDPGRLMRLLIKLGFGPQDTDGSPIDDPEQLLDLPEYVVFMQTRPGIPPIRTLENDTDSPCEYVLT
jgi:FkbM family methyltransferase